MIEVSSGVSATAEMAVLVSQRLADLALGPTSAPTAASG